MEGLYVKFLHILQDKADLGLSNTDTARLLTNEVTGQAMLNIAEDVRNDLKAMTCARNRFCAEINAIAKAVGMGSKSHFAPEAVRCKVEDIVGRYQKLALAVYRSDNATVQKILKAVVSSGEIQTGDPGNSDDHETIDYCRAAS